MKNHTLRNFLFLWLMLGMGACVSVKIPTSSGTPAKDVKYASPESPFKELEDVSGDKAWVSEKTGNTISYISECKGNVDPTLLDIEGEALGVFNKLKILETSTFDFNGREARRTQAQGELDGVLVKTELVVFKKNGCNFTLSYGGVHKTFDSEKNYFQKFLESFRAQ